VNYGPGTSVSIQPVAYVNVGRPPRTGRAAYDGAVAKRNRNSSVKAGAPAASGNDENPMDTFFGELGTTIAAGDVLNAEIETSGLLAMISEADRPAAEMAQLVDAVVGVASNELYGPEGSAYLRLLLSLGPRAVKRAASAALAELTADDVYPPDWVTSIGKPAPGQAWRLYDVAGDREVVVATYRYGDAEHALLVSIDLAELPLAGLAHVPNTFTLSAELHDGLRPAVTAWVRWAAVHQGLDEAAAEHLTERVPVIFSEFQAAYDDPDRGAARGYMRDLVTADADVAWLAEQRARREFAVPFPDERDAGVAAIDAAAARRVVEEIWKEDPAQTWQEADARPAKTRLALVVGTAQTVW
jgi:hypothetical protein